MELSNLSFLKPHIINESIYQLSHKGHTRAHAHKPDVVKSIEQHRRYKKFLTGRQQPRMTSMSSNYPKNYNLNTVSSSLEPNMK